MRLSRRFAMLGLAATCVTAGAQAWTATVTRPGTAFGTTVRLTISAPTLRQAEACCDAGFAEIRKVERAFSLFDPASELMRLNSTAVLHDPSAMMLELLGVARELWVMTDGAFDPTVQRLWQAWARGESVEVARLQRDIGFQQVEITPEKVSLLNPGATLTLNGIAQGFAADCVARAIAPLGAEAAVLDTGETAIIGEHVNNRFAVAHPRKRGAAIGYITVAGGFVATSGDYASSFTADFSQHHIFDPATGESPLELACATVLAGSGALADGLATAFMVMGVAKAKEYMRRTPAVSAVLVDKDMEVHISGAGAARFVPAA